MTDAGGPRRAVHPQIDSALRGRGDRLEVAAAAGLSLDPGQAAGLVDTWPQHATIAASPTCSPEAAPGSEAVALSRRDSRRGTLPPPARSGPRSQVAGGRRG